MSSILYSKERRDFLNILNIIMDLITIYYIKYRQRGTTPQGDLKTCQVFQPNKQTNGFIRVSVVSHSKRT